MINHILTRFVIFVMVFLTGYSEAVKGLKGACADYSKLESVLTSGKKFKKINQRDIIGHWRHVYDEDTDSDTQDDVHACLATTFINVTNPTTSAQEYQMVTGRLYELKSYMRHIPEQEAFANITRYVVDDTKYIKFSEEVGKTNTAAIFDPKGKNGSYKKYADDMHRFSVKKRYNETELEKMPKNFQVEYAKEQRNGDKAKRKLLKEKYGEIFEKDYFKVVKFWQAGPTAALMLTWSCHQYPKKFGSVEADKLFQYPIIADAIKEQEKDNEKFQKFLTDLQVKGIPTDTNYEKSVTNAHFKELQKELDEFATHFESWYADIIHEGDLIHWEAFKKALISKEPSERTVEDLMNHDFTLKFLTRQDKPSDLDFEEALDKAKNEKVYKDLDMATYPVLGVKLRGSHHIITQNHKICPFGDLTMHKDNTPKAHVDAYRKLHEMADKFRYDRMKQDPRLAKIMAEREANNAAIKQRKVDAQEALWKEGDETDSHRGTGKGSEDDIAEMMKEEGMEEEIYKPEMQEGAAMKELGTEKPGERQKIKIFKTEEQQKEADEKAKLEEEEAKEAELERLEDEKEENKKYEL